MNALMLMPLVAAALRNCLASWSSSEIVVLMMHYHNASSSLHHYPPERATVSIATTPSSPSEFGAPATYSVGMTGSTT